MCAVIPTAAAAEGTELPVVTARQNRTNHSSDQGTVACEVRWFLRMEGVTDPSRHAKDKSRNKPIRSRTKASPQLRVKASRAADVIPSAG